MAVGIVADNAAAKPEDLANAKKSGENLLVILAGESRVPLLHLAEQALFRGQQTALPIDVDGAPFQCDGPLTDPELRTLIADVQALGNPARNLIVGLPVVVLGPTIEPPVKNPRSQAFAYDEHRSIVPCPDPIGAKMPEADPFPVEHKLG